MELSHYDLLAELFAHPGPSYRDHVVRAGELLDSSYPEAGRLLDKFLEGLPDGDLLTLQELHTRTFDVQPITTLDLGYTLFGEDYKRGALLAGLSREHTTAKNDCSTELADHLTNVLRLLPRMADHAVREELVTVIVAPAVREMIREFEPERVAKKEKLYKKHHKTIIEAPTGETRTVYCYALQALFEVLKADFALRVSLPIDQKSTFEKSVGVEMGIEGCDTCGSDATAESCAASVTP